MDFSNLSIDFYISTHDSNKKSAQVCMFVECFNKKKKRILGYVWLLKSTKERKK